MNVDFYTFIMMTVELGVYIIQDRLCDVLVMLIFFITIIIYS